LPGTALPSDFTVQTAVSFKGLPLADMTRLAVTRQPAFERTAEILRILLILHDAVFRLIICRTIAMAWVRVVSGNGAALPTTPPLRKHERSEKEARLKQIFMSNPPNVDTQPLGTGTVDSTGSVSSST
jgi:hypothetical protein